VQLVTNGLKVTEYRPDRDGQVGRRARALPENRRSLDQLDELRINTPMGSVPIGNFVSRKPAQKVGQINRVNSIRVVTVTSNVAEGVQSAVVQKRSRTLCAGGSRIRRDVPDEGRGRGAREGRRLPG
jgi:multidrug efflux pump